MKKVWLVTVTTTSKGLFGSSITVVDKVVDSFEKAKTRLLELKDNYSKRSANKKWITVSDRQLMRVENLPSGYCSSITNLHIVEHEVL